MWNWNIWWTNIQLELYLNSRQFYFSFLIFSFSSIPSKPLSETLPIANSEWPIPVSSEQDDGMINGMSSDEEISFLNLLPPLSIFTKAEEQFFIMLNDDLITVNQFFKKQLVFFNDKFNIISDQLERLVSTEFRNDSIIYCLLYK